MIDDEAPPPRKRLRMTLEIDAHDQADIHRILNSLAIDTLREPMPCSSTSSAGYHYTVENLGPEYTPERYEAELDAWISQRRVNRRVSA